MKRRRRLFIALAAPAVSLLMLIVGGCAITCRPSWYKPTMLDYSRLAEDKRDLARTIETVNVALNEGRPITVELEQDQVNRWIAARSEWPEDWYHVQIDPLRDPMVSFLDGNRVRIAALAERAGFGTVVSCTIGFELVDDRLVLRWAGAGAGVLPVPRALLAQAVRGVPESEQVLRDLLSEGTTVRPNRWVWPNGKPRFRITELHVENGRLRVSLEPR
jgi:hypothetical protein